MRTRGTASREQKLQEIITRNPSEAFNYRLEAHSPADRIDNAARFVLEVYQVAADINQLHNRRVIEAFQQIFRAILPEEKRLIPKTVVGILEAYKRMPEEIPDGLIELWHRYASENNNLA